MHQRHLGEPADTSGGPDGLTACVCQPWPWPLLLKPATVNAKSLPPGEAIRTGSTEDGQARDDAIAGSECDDGTADLDDLPHDLVAKNYRHSRLEDPVNLVQVGVAQASDVNPDQDFLGHRIVDNELLDLQRPGCTVKHRRCDVRTHASSK
jgi:hypothetical protein